MKIDLKGSLALVTGAARGIGRAILEEFARCGASVIGVDANGDVLRKTAQQLKDRGLSILVKELDVRDDASIEDMSRNLAVDILVNCAAIVLPPMPFHEVPLVEWEKIVAVDLTGPFLCCKHFVLPMIRQRRGVIINVASVAGKIPRKGMAPYCSAKAGLIHLTKVMALELAPYGIRVNALCPGTTGTEMVLRDLTGGKKELIDAWLRSVPLGRFATVEQQASLAVFLASDFAGHITGQAINVDGGQVMW